jgi:hypothetical protein
MGNLFATPTSSNYRRTLSGSNRTKVIQQLDNESIDLVYVLYIYAILLLCTIAVIYLYSIKEEGIPKFSGDKQRDANSQESYWQRFIRWLQETHSDRRCPRQIPTISTPAVPTTASATNGLCAAANTSTYKADSDCIQ